MSATIDRRPPHREWGFHPTHPHLAAKITNLALGAWLARIRPLRDTQPAAWMAALRGPKILDPAVGHGVFLVAALRRLHAEFSGENDGETHTDWAREGNADYLAEWLRRSLFGVDIDANAVAIAKSEIRAAAVELGLSRARASRIEVPIIVGDALRREAWPAIFPALAGENGRPTVDVLLMNPPWISYGNRQAVTLAPARREYLRTAFPRGFSGFPTSHGPFLELAADLARGGFVGAIVPEQVAHLAGYAGARAALTEQHELAHVEPVGEDNFAGVKEPAVILVTAPTTTKPAPQAAKTTAANWLTSGGSASAIVRAMAKWPTFGDCDARAFADIGVHTGGYSREIIAARDATFTAARGGDDWRPIRRGRDVAFHVVLAPSEMVRLSPVNVPAHAKARTLPRIPPFSRLREVPILIRQTANRPIAALHGTGEPGYFRNSVLAVRGAESLPGACAEVLTAVLNSAPMAFLHRAMQPDARQKTSPQVKIRHLRELPAPPMPTVLAAELARVMAEIVAVQIARRDGRESAKSKVARSRQLDAFEATVTQLVADWLGLSRGQVATIRGAVEPWSRANLRAD